MRGESGFPTTRFLMSEQNPQHLLDDVALCARLREAATLLGIAVLDFLIVVEGR